MKKREAWQCDFCRKMVINSETMERHEKQCLKNPNSFNCYRCKGAYMGTTYEHYEYYVDDFNYASGENEIKDVAMCWFSDEQINVDGNNANKCKHYERSEDMYMYRNNDDAGNWANTKRAEALKLLED